MFGLPMQVGSRDELVEMACGSDEPAYYMVTRCADLPEEVIPLSVRLRNLRTPCEQCGEICWYDSKNFIPFTIVTCSVCMAGKPDVEQMQRYAGTDQVREIADNFGRGRPGRRGRRQGR